MNLFAYAAPQRFLRLTQAAPWLYGLAAVLALWGLYQGFFVAPVDATQGNSYRIIFLHVPAAWMSMFIYLVMAFYGVLLFVFKTRLSGMMIRALAPTGALMTFIALWSGALWGRPTWGAYWVWDARLTSELLLLFLYAGVIALYSSIDDVKRGDSAAALLCIVGSINIPIIYFSVRWWNTLHQGASVSPMGDSKMHATMLQAMLVMSLAAWAYSIATALSRARAIVYEREGARLGHEARLKESS